MQLQMIGFEWQWCGLVGEIQCFVFQQDGIDMVWFGQLLIVQCNVDIFGYQGCGLVIMIKCDVFQYDMRWCGKMVIYCFEGQMIVVIFGNLCVDMFCFLVGLQKKIEVSDCY